jgi:RsiW-degrading membrane proteinase PrsW (M82 family)
LLLSFIRFIGATFLHTLCSAIVGYAIAISLCDEKNRRLEAISGIVLAVVLHGVYDFSIIALEGSFKIIIPITILIILAIFTSLGFEKLKKLKSVCKLNPYGIREQSKHLSHTIKK